MFFGRRLFSRACQNNCATAVDDQLLGQGRTGQRSDAHEGTMHFPTDTRSCRRFRTSILVDRVARTTPTTRAQEQRSRTGATTASLLFERDECARRRQPRWPSARATPPPWPSTRCRTRAGQSGSVRDTALQWPPTSRRCNPFRIFRGGLIAVTLGDPTRRLCRPDQEVVSPVDPERLM